MKSFFLAFWLITTAIFAQNGIVKGTVLDKQSLQPITNVNVLVDTEAVEGTMTDSNGEFRMEVPVGRHFFVFEILGYETAVLANIEVNSGKDTQLEVLMQEQLNTLDEVVIKASTSKAKPLNELAVVSARQFGMEEVSRYSGGRGDVARLATNFAGVSSANDSRNDIIIRGNSPTGLLWRLEGVPIPNPNHFATAGTTGGPVGAVNPNLLKNSDFLTSAFPAEYGNAIGGVFDLSYRNGNSDSYEYTAQVGAFTGFEAMAEGP